jgi:methionyl aminopeptidase
MQEATIKTAEEIAIMKQGGLRLGKVKAALRKMVKAGTKASQIEIEAVRLIEKAGGKPSFKMVEGYSWATCINVNEGLVHGIPKPSLLFKQGDVVSVDVGMYYKGFHTDTSFSVAIEGTAEVKKFMETGEAALKKAIAEATVGNKIFDISKAIQDTIEAAGYSSIRALTGHGVGRELHEEPKITCFVVEPREESLEIKPGMVLAIEIMYAQGKPDVELAKDGWTISVRDGKISALFEETVAVTPHGPLVLTEG